MVFGRKEQCLLYGWTSFQGQDALYIVQLRSMKDSGKIEYWWSIKNSDGFWKKRAMSLVWVDELQRPLCLEAAATNDQPTVNQIQCAMCKMHCAMCKKYWSHLQNLKCTRSEIPISALAGPVDFADSEAWESQRWGGKPEDRQATSHLVVGLRAV